MADEGSAKENEGDKKVIHTYPLVKVNASRVRRIKHSLPKGAIFIV